MTYRDGLGPRWRRACDELEFERARLERLPSAAGRSLPKALRARLDAAPEPGWFDPTKLGEIERAEGAVAELRAALDEAEVLASEVAAAERREKARAAPLPSKVRGVRPPPPWSHVLSVYPQGDSAADFAENAEELGRLLVRHGAAPSWVAFWAVAAQFERGGVPYRLRLTRPPVDKGVSWANAFSLTTTVPQTAPSFRLMPQTGLDDLLQALRLQKSHDVGDEAFDTRFRVVGDPGCVALLGPELRGALLTVANADVPSLAVGDGEALLRWNAPASESLLEAALRGLAALRAAAGRAGG